MEWIEWLFDYSESMPRRQCSVHGEMPDWLVSLYVFNSWIMFLSYVIIPLTLLSFYSSLKPLLDRISRFTVLCSVGFILSCGLTHAIDATMFDAPRYRLMAFALTAAAIISAVSAVVFISAALHLSIQLGELRAREERSKEVVSGLKEYVGQLEECKATLVTEVKTLKEALDAFE